MLLANQSIPMAIHTPRIPIWNTIPKRHAVPNQNTSMEPIPIYIVIFASPDALKLFTRLKDVGCKKNASTLCIRTNIQVRLHVTSDN